MCRKSVESRAKKKARTLTFAVVASALLIFSTTSRAKNIVDWKIQLLTHDLIAEVNFDKDEFRSWAKELTRTIEDLLADDKTNRDVVIQVTLHKDKDTSTEISARPAYTEIERSTFTAGLVKMKCPRAYFTDYSLLCILQINEGCQDPDLRFSPPVLTPVEKNKRKFSSASLEDQNKVMQDWARSEVIPILGTVAANVGQEFEGVRAIGRMLLSTDFRKEQNVRELTEQNSHYRRAMVEMAVGDQLIPAARIFMHTANAEFDIARRYLFAIRPFSGPNTLARYFLDELAWRFSAFYGALEDEITKGIDLHDKGSYKHAVSHYEKILSTYPKSAWANYELYYSRLLLKAADDTQTQYDWAKARAIVYACDPLYSVAVEAGTGKEGYLLFRRKEIDTLFKSQDALKPDLLRYADISLDLGEYGFASQLYWLILNSFSQEECNGRNILAHYLYCLDKLGDKLIIKNFKGDFKTEFQAIEQQRNRLMRESDIYNVFSKKDE